MIDRLLTPPPTATVPSANEQASLELCYWAASAALSGVVVVAGGAAAAGAAAAGGEEQGGAAGEEGAEGGAVAVAATVVVDSGAAVRSWIDSMRGAERRYERAARGPCKWKLWANAVAGHVDVDPSQASVRSLPRRGRNTNTNTTAKPDAHPSQFEGIEHEGVVTGVECPSHPGRMVRPMDDSLLAWGDAETERRRAQAAVSAARSREQEGLPARSSQVALATIEISKSEKLGTRVGNPMRGIWSSESSLVRRLMTASQQA